MSTVDVVVESKTSRSIRARQLETMFDVSPTSTSRLAWSFDAPFDDQPWTVGLIVGPSGSGKSTIAQHLFGTRSSLAWGRDAVVDDFDERFGIEHVVEVCMSVGFNTIPAWLRPYAVLSTGERFRVELARVLLESASGRPIVFDEFSSVVDRQVAKCAAHAVQKFARRAQKRFVAVTCHYDVEEWLQPDWVIEPASQSFRRRSLQRRPEISCRIAPVDYEVWSTFAPFHYLTNTLHRSARCWALYVDERLAAFAGMLHRPISRAGADTRSIMGCSRLVTLSDFQGLGLAFVLIDRVASIYATLDQRTRTYPAHPALVRSFDRSSSWTMIKKPGVYSSRNKNSDTYGTGNRPCAVFEYVGAQATIEDTIATMEYWA